MHVGINLGGGIESANWCSTRVHVFLGDGDLCVSLLCRLKAPRHPSQEDTKNMFLRSDGYEKGDLEALEASPGDVGQEEQTAAEQEAARAALRFASAG